MNKHEHCCQRCDDTEEAIKTRNEHTKLWIQADIQTRQYANSLERRIEELEAELAVTRPSHVRLTSQNWVENPFWATNTGADWCKVPCTGKDKIEAYETLINYLSNYSIIVPQKNMTMFDRMTDALRKLQGVGWLYWPANRQPDPRVVMYESRTLKEIEDLAKTALPEVKYDLAYYAAGTDTRGSGVPAVWRQSLQHQEVPPGPECPSSVDADRLPSD